MGRITSTQSFRANLEIVAGGSFFNKTPMQKAKMKAKAMTMIRLLTLVALSILD